MNSVSTKLIIFIGALSAYSASAASVAITETALGNPTQNDLQNGYVVNDFAGYIGLTLTITATGNHDTATSPEVDGSVFRNSMPTANIANEPGYTFEFDGNGLHLVTSLTLSSANNIFSRNISGTGFQIRERVTAELTGGTWDSVTPNSGGNTGQLQINGVGTADASISINLPSQAQTAFDTSGYTAVASGTSISEFVYTYDLAALSNGGQAPNTLQTNQPFSLTLEIESVPEPSTGTLVSFTAFCLCLRRKRK